MKLDLMEVTLEQMSVLGHENVFFASWYNRDKDMHEIVTCKWSSREEAVLFWDTDEEDWEVWENFYRADPALYIQKTTGEINEV